MTRMLSKLMAALTVVDEPVAESKKNDSDKPLMIIGPSAVGKNTMINRLKTKYPNVINKLPSYKTRPIRSGEKDGVDYYFVTKEEFIRLKKKENSSGFKSTIITGTPQIKKGWKNP